MSEVYPELRLAVHKWGLPAADGAAPASGAAICVFHGYGAHAAYPTCRYAAELLAAAGHVVYGLDLPGHGESPGVRGLIRDPVRQF